MTAKRTTQVRLTREAANALRRLAGDLGFVQTRGILAGELGSIAQMLEAVANGELNVVQAPNAEEGDRDVSLFEMRKLIAHIQALISAHRYPDMYDVTGVIADAEQAWKKANTYVNNSLPQQDAKE